MDPNPIKVGFFLAIRQIIRSTPWTTGLIIFIMTLTFLNLVVVSGILLGLVEGSSKAYRAQYSGDILIKPQPLLKYIRGTNNILKIAANLSEVGAVSPRYLSAAKIEADYKKIPAPNQSTDSINTVIAGIDPKNENEATALASLVVEGEYLDLTDEDVILVGSSLLKKYTLGAIIGQALQNAQVGDKVRLTINGYPREVTIKGVLKSKITDVNGRIYMNEGWFRRIVSRSSNDSSEIAIKLRPGSDYYKVKDDLARSSLDKSALVQTWDESQGEFFKQLAGTFVILGNFIGGIALAVSSVTIFIVIFINAITRKKYIGILKGIGIKGGAITISYLIQSLFYSLVGSLIGLGLLYGAIKPYFDQNPIDFPFSDGILVATYSGTLFRIFLLFSATLVAGYIPAKLIIRKKTLDSILGR